MTWHCHRHHSNKFSLRLRVAYGMVYGDLGFWFVSVVLW